MKSWYKHNQASHCPLMSWVGDLTKICFFFSIESLFSQTVKTVAEDKCHISSYILSVYSGKKCPFNWNVIFPVIRRDFSHNEMTIWWPLGYQYAFCTSRFSLHAPPVHTIQSDHCFKFRSQRWIRMRFIQSVLLVNVCSIKVVKMHLRVCKGKTWPSGRQLKNSRMAQHRPCPQKQRPSSSKTGPLDCFPIL